MLKAIELTGFKSFADRTRIEFPPGITVVVGPNGSGKSNVVDAMKWVLGARAASALRGKAMADVIFKGSTSRKPANTAEATIYFENVDNIFNIDTEEVRVTRRIYRSGEGEYLINGDTCRLRDIQNMFRGTGVGVDGYSLIEQGKVSDLLTASPRDRRAIFEEAAGISRFKAKKIESQRRLERVDQNLLRLSDIVEEVDNRLRRLKSQAGKAQRYKQYSDRLQELRTHVGRVDWQDLTSRLTVLDADMTSVVDSVNGYAEEIQATEEQGAGLESAFAQLEEQLQVLQRKSIQVRENIASRQSTIESDRERIEELADESTRYARQLQSMTSKVESLQRELASATEEMATARAEHEHKVAEAEQCEVVRKEATEKLEQARAEVESRRNERVERMQFAADLTNRVTSHQSLIDASATATEKLSSRLADVEQAREAATAELEQVTGELSDAESNHEKHAAELSTAREKLDSSLQAYDKARQALVDLRQRAAVVGERTTLLQDIEKRMEGVGSGVRKMLELVASDEEGPLGAVRGMVADLITVKEREHADMVAVALGERAQHLVVAGTQFLDHLASGEFSPPGRVGFVRLQSTAPPRFLREVELDGQPGVIGRADRFVESNTEYEHLAEWLLGDTWFVETLADAIQYHRSLKLPPRFVTVAGEALDRDGRLLAGPTTLELELIPRRAELNELAIETSRLDEQVSESEKEQVVFADEKEEWERRLSELASQDEQARSELESLRLKVQAAETSVKSLNLQHGELAEELDAAKTQGNDASSLMATAQAELVDVQAIIATLQAALSGFRDSVSTLESEEKDLAAKATAARVALAKSEQRFDALQMRYEQMERDHDSLDDSFRELREQTRDVASRQETANLRILNATSELAELFLHEEEAKSAGRITLNRRNELHQQRAQWNEQLKQLREEQSQIQSRKHSLEMESERIRSERTILAERLLEDYGIEIEALLAAPTANAMVDGGSESGIDDEVEGVTEADGEDSLGLVEAEDRSTVDEEIAGLRRKITNIGSVNMDALDELSDLESRHSSLTEQYQDLIDAKEALEKIIDKINADSRRLFVESLTTIRTNFQQLFRKVFGGGSADLVLEEDVDILESGIDIMATPPGKTSFALSLLSGGEQALTAVTLLLAIFEYRPSPFCVLDEVDGPLDEANIGRFIDVLHEFLEWTKFVVVTHSKKTMAAANTLHGVTMQESGVSKRVSVRFEDVSEDGHISESAIDRARDSA